MNSEELRQEDVYKNLVKTQATAIEAMLEFVNLLVEKSVDKALSDYKAGEEQRVRQIITEFFNEKNPIVSKQITPSLPVIRKYDNQHSSENLFRGQSQQVGTKTVSSSKQEVEFEVLDTDFADGAEKRKASQESKVVFEEKAIFSESSLPAESQYVVPKTITEVVGKQYTIVDKFIKGSFSYALKLMVEPKIAEKLGLYGGYNEWFDDRENLIKSADLVIASGMVTYFADPVPGESNKYYIVPRIRKFPAEYNAVSMALLKYFDYDYKLSTINTKKINVVVPATVVKTGEETYALSNKGVLSYN